MISGMDIRRLISIAQDYKSITRLHEYPVYMYTHTKFQDLGPSSHDLGPSFRSLNDGNNLSEMGGKNTTKNSANINENNVAHSVSNNPGKNLVNNPGKNQNLGSQLNMMKNKKISRRSDPAGQGLGLGLDFNSVGETISPDLNSILCNLKGNTCLDSICCAYGISPSEILDSQMYHIIYK